MGCMKIRILECNSDNALSEEALSNAMKNDILDGLFPCYVSKNDYQIYILIASFPGLFSAVDGKFLKGEGLMQLL